MKQKTFERFLFVGLGMICLLSSGGTSCAQHRQDIHVIPAPAAVEMKKGHFLLGNDVKIVVQTHTKEIYDIASYLSSQGKLVSNLDIQIVESVEPGYSTIKLDIDTHAVKKESYRLQIHKKEILVVGASPSGLFYGIQTLLQLMDVPRRKANEFSVPCLDIQDEPTFAWRGMHLDVSRHFFPVAFIKKMIDMLAMQKMNVFHWHLTDDQGWRIEIKKYPRLTEIGSYREDTIPIVTSAGNTGEVSRVCGYYTQDEIRDVVSYAQSRYVTIVPEIEMPGHAVAALSAYPEFSCTGGPFKVYNQWGITEDVFCPGKDATFEFLENILNEVIELFPGPYIHIGGDECPKTRWKTCSLCQNRIREEKLKGESDLQSYFTKRIEKFVASRGKKLIGWDEILEGGLPERAAVMSWRGMKGGIEAARSGHDVVMTPTDYCYFDLYQAQKNEPKAQEGFLPLEKVYSFNPVPLTLPMPGRLHILGAQANVWTEYISTEQHAEYMIFPRLCAMAEVLWTPPGKQDFTSFRSRLPFYLNRLQKYHVSYRPL